MYNDTLALEPILTGSYPKRLIEVDLPIKKISAHARREKSIRLRQDGDISEGIIISPKSLVRNWSGAHKEWSTKAVGKAVFASPLFPRGSTAIWYGTPSRRA